MAARKSYNLLPGVFQTDANKKFLSATVDQLISEPDLKDINGYIGRKFAPTYKNQDSYIVEGTENKQNYQLEPSVVVRDDSSNVNFFATYTDLLDKIRYYGGITTDHSRLFDTNYYSFDPLISFDKFVNFSQYYWLPYGPAAVNVNTSGVELTQTFEVTRTPNGYLFLSNGVTYTNLTLARGGTYQFNVDQPGVPFWLQSELGVDGLLNATPTIGSRDVLGVENNGTDSGTITFNVPQATAQDRFNKMTNVFNVEYAVPFNLLPYKNLHNKTLSQFLAAYPQYAGITGTLDGKHLVFVDVSEATNVGDETWTASTVIDPNTDLPITGWGEGEVVAESLRYGVWRVQFIDLGIGDPLLRLVHELDVNLDEKVYVKYGVGNANKEFYKEFDGFFREVPLLTAMQDTLYLQDGIVTRFYAAIKLVESVGWTIDVENDIIGKKNYTSPNGVVFTSGLKIRFDTDVTPASYQDKEYYVEQVGADSGIRLVDTELLVRPEGYNDEIALNYPLNRIVLTKEITTAIPAGTVISAGDIDVEVYAETVAGKNYITTLASTDNIVLGDIVAGPGIPAGCFVASLRPDYVAAEYITINRASIDLNAWSRNNRWFHRDIITLTAQYNNSQLTFDQELRAQRPIVQFECDLQLLNNGRKYKKPIDILDTSTLDAFNELEGYIVNDGVITYGTSAAESSSSLVTYTTSGPGGAETSVVERVLDASQNVYYNGEYIGTTATVRIIDESALGITLYDGLRVLFANDQDPLVRDKIYVLNLVQYSADPFTEIPNGPKHIKLTIADDGDADTYDTVVVTKGQYRGSQWWYDGVRWLESQQKTQVQQDPLFDIFDPTGVSLTTYTRSTFVGAKIFGYDRTGTGTNDPVLGFPLKYRSFATQGDIEFANYFNSDTFTYAVDQNIITKNINLGFVYQITDKNNPIQKNTWNVVPESTRQYQLISYIYDGSNSPFEIDVTPSADQLSIPYLKVFKNNSYLQQTIIDTTGTLVYNWLLADNKITLTTAPTIGDKIDILVYSREISELGHYEIPLNLDLNAQNVDIDSLTLGQLRNHLVELGRNSTNLIGPILGSSNLRDIEIKSQGGSILQHAAPLPYASLFLIDQTANFVNATRYAQQEYTKFKNKFLEYSSSLQGIDPRNAASSVDLILTTINAIKNKTFPWYYSDMVPYGTLRNVVNDPGYTVFDPFVRSYEITSVFNSVELSNRAVLVYLTPSTNRNDGEWPAGEQRQLTVLYNYVFETDRPAITFTDKTELQIDDLITIVEYSNTDGNYIPETPSKLGLYPRYIPTKFTDDTYREEIDVIRGHDGSLTPAFGDYRDDFLLELERRIYNNIKLPDVDTYQDMLQVRPGKFRDSLYNINEINQVLGNHFMTWVGNNKVDFATNDTFDPNDAFTWNYSKFQDTIDGEPLPGSWRSCFLYFFDTVRPHLMPWEMLGFTTEPDWWQGYYGPAPYTGGNKLLWDDLEAGRIRDGNRSQIDRGLGAGIDSNYIRPGLSRIIPVDDNGFLKSPAQIITAAFSSNRAGTSWGVGQYGPVEWAWRTSSDFAFAAQLALAVVKPALYFGRLMDTYRYTLNSDLDQYLTASSQHHVRQDDIGVNGDEASGTVYRSAGYLNWIGDYLRNQGINPVTKIGTMLKNYSVNLAYKMSGFTDQRYLKVLAEQSSPSSTNDSILVPNENYEVYLNEQPVPISKLTYSAVIIEKTNSGWSVRGYDLTSSYFTIIPSVVNNNAYKIKVLNSEGVVFQDYQPIKLTVPYGFEFISQQQVVDFLISYERYLLAQGFVFNETDDMLGETRNWRLSVKEFLFWAQQGWKEGSILVLSPVANSLSAISINAITAGIDDSQYGSKVLDQNFALIKNNNYSVLRTPTNFNVTLTDSASVIGYVEVNLVQFEHALIFDNATVFNDIIYKPELGNRQYRLKLIGQKTASWDGSLSAPGFIYNSSTIQPWVLGIDYLKGDLVTYKNKYYVALQNIVANTQFDFQYWKQIATTEIKTGLLPNFSSIAVKSQSSYDAYGYFEDIEQQKYSHGLIGFKPRQYLDDLGLNETTQIEFYKGYIKQKGTNNAVDALKKTTFNNLSSDINYYEEWAVRIGEYGALDNNPYVEIALDEKTYSVNPAIAQFVSDANKNLADGLSIFNSSQLYKSTNQFNGNIALNRDAQSDYDSDIPTAGYVNIDDVDTTIYDLANYVDLDGKIADMGSGYTIWCAKDFSQQWNVYRVTETNNYITAVTNSLDGFITFTSETPHGFLVNDVFLIKGFAAEFDGFYQVIMKEDNNNIMVKFNGGADVLATLTTQTGRGILYTLDSMRFAFMEDSRVYGQPLNGWKLGDKIWIDRDAETTPVQGQPYSPTNTWKVYEKQAPWTLKQPLNRSASENTSADGFGTSARTSADGYITVVGAPYLGNGTVYTFLKDLNENFSESFRVTSVAANTRAFGYSVDIGIDTESNSTLAVGAPQSYGNVGYVHIYSKAINSVTFERSQILVGNVLVPGENFGTSLTFNQDATWLYIGAPGNATVNADTVYAYGLNKFIPEERQITSVNNENYVKLTGTITAANGDVLTQPLTGASIVVDGNFTATSNIKVDSLTNIVSDSSLANVALSGNIRANVGDFVTQTTSGANIFVYSAQADVNSVYGTYVNAFTFDTTGNIAINGVVQVVATNSGNANVATWSNVGIKPTTVGSGNIFLNGVDTGRYPDETFTRSVTNRIEITGWIPAVTNDANSILVTSGVKTFIPNIDYVLTGANVIFTSNLVQDDYTITQQPYFALVTTIKVPPANAGSRFGEALSSSFDGAQLAVGAPNDTVLGLPGAGSVWVYDRVIEAFNSTGSTTYTTKGNIDAVHRVTIDEIEVTNYDVTGTNTIEFIEPPPVGKLVFVETNAFILLEKLIGVDSLEGGTGAIQANAAFGTSLTICSNNCAIYIGAPFYDNGSKYNTGAVWKFHNKGRLYGTNFGFLDNPTFTVGDTIRLDNFEITVANVNSPSSSVASLDDVVENINSANLLGISAVNENGRLRLNTDKTVAKNLLRILSGTNSPGSDGVYAAAGLIVFAFMQIIINPFNAEGEYFGNKVKLAANAYALVIGSKRGTTRRFATFDADGTTFDDATTRWFDSITGSGSVYFYELYDDPRDAVEKPGRYAYAQQLDTGDLAMGDEFGAAVDIEGGYVTVSSPGREYTDVDGNVIVDAGAVYIFENPERIRGWKLIRWQQPKVDIDTVNRMYLYNSLTNTIVSNLEFIDPAKGKILGLAEQEISFKTEYDPAVYNRGTNPEVIVNSSLYWNSNQVGKVWWNLSKIRFIDYEQDSLTYRSINWGRLFPGSSVEVCEWVESTVLPSQYVANGGDGVPKYADDSAYVELTYVDAVTNIITSKFYYWVLDKTTVDPNDETRILPIKSIQDYISNPKGQGISYAAIIRNDAMIVYNVSEYLSAKNTILHLDYELTKNTNIIHSEYELIQRGNPDNYIPAKITNKLIDSLAGITEEGKVVPDPKLSVADRYGIGFRPRQSMFVNRLSAIDELVSYVNGVLINSPVAKEFDISQLMAEEPIPSKKLDEYHESVNTRQELDYLDTTPLEEGHIVLVLNDETQDNLWVLYTLTADKEWQISRVQSYKTSLYWTYEDWYGLKADGETRYSAGDKITYSVETLVDALKLSYAPDDIIRINNTGNGKWQQVLVNDNYGFDTIGIQDGTVQLNTSLGDFADNGLGFGNQGYSSNRYDQNPNIEIRNILNSLKDDIFISTLQGEYNKTFFVIVNYLFEEQKYVDWIFKTSFISVTHNLRPLNQYPNYVKDNQSYYLDYINEVKPYRTKTREYLINYNGDDVFGGDITDFDLPPYYDADLRIFRSPSGELVEKDQATWQTDGYTQWYANRNPKLFSIIVESGGSGYVAEPTITIVGGNATTQATARAVIDFDTGAVTDIYVITYGSGYTTTPTVLINGSSDTPAVAYAVLSNQQVRTFDTTLKFDRISYGTTVQQWSPNTFFLANTIVSYSGQGYITPANITTGSTFVSSDFEIYSANLFTNANDRIMAYYDPSTGMPAKDLNQLLYGIEYPGVQVQGVSYNQTPGFSGSAVLQIVLNSAVTVYAGNVITQTYNVNFGSDTTPNVQPVTASITVTNTAVTATRIYGTMDTTADFTLGNVVSIDGTASSAYPLQANLYVPSTVGATFDFSPFDNVEYNEDGSPILSEDFLDTVIRSTYTDSSLGLRPEDIDVDGGAYVDRYSSHAPEELIPGIIYDTLDMKVYTKINANVDVIGYRMFNRSFQTWGNAAVGTSINETSYLRIADSYSTTLAQELALTDTEIYLTDASVLPVPGTATATPGVVFIGAERIVYWTIDYTANTLGQLRRGTNGTGAKSIYGAGTIVVDGSIQQQVPNTVFANINLAPAGANVIIGNINVWFNDGNHVTTSVDGTGLNGSTTAAALFLKAATAGVVVGSTIPDALVTEDTINTISTEDGTDIFEEDQE